MKTYSDPLVTQVRDAAARLLFQSAWADACENETCPACLANPDHPDEETQFDNRTCLECAEAIPMAGSGEDWAEVLAHLEPPPEAYAKADELIEALGGEAEAFDRLAEWDTAIQQPDELGVAEFELLDNSAERFGVALAFQSLGSGVSLCDDVPFGVSYTRPEVPLIEFHASMFDGAKVLRKAREKK